MDWAEAQRFVNQVEVDDYQTISAIRNLPVLVASIFMVIGGLALLVVSVGTIIPGSIQLPIYLSTRNILYAAVTGFMMIVGGLVGIIQSWQHMQ